MSDAGLCAWPLVKSHETIGLSTEEIPLIWLLRWLPSSGQKYLLSVLSKLEITILPYCWNTEAIDLSNLHSPQIVDYQSVFIVGHSWEKTPFTELCSFHPCLWVYSYFSLSLSKLGQWYLLPDAFKPTFQLLLTYSFSASDSVVHLLPRHSSSRFTKYFHGMTRVTSFADYHIFLTSKPRQLHL